MNTGGEGAAVEVRRVGSWLIPLLCAILGLACDDGGGSGLNPNYSEPMVWGYLFKAEYSDLTLEYDKDFEVFDYDGLRMVPVVMLNGIQVEAYSYSATGYKYGDSDVIPTYQQYELEVRHYWGTGFCHLVMPADFVLTAPPKNFVLGQDSTLVATWRTSRGAQWYWLSIYMDYDYYDTAGMWDNYVFRLDTLVQDTAFALPSERMFPPFVATVIEGDGSVTVWSGYGPAIEPGDIGNVRGAAFGYVNAVNEPREEYFYVTAASAARRAPDSRIVAEQFKARLRNRMSGR